MRTLVHWLNSAAGVLAVLMVAGCSRDLSGPAVDPVRTSSLSLIQGVGTVDIQDIRGVEVGLPPEPRSWDTSTVALRDTIVGADGHAVIAIKARGSRRTLESGNRASVNKEVILEGLDLLRTRGVEILDYYDKIGLVHVRIDPAQADSLVPFLAASPIIDFVEPAQVVPLAASRASVPPVASVRAQTTPWGITMVRAPEAWSITSGAGVKIKIIDSGHEQGHEDLPLVPTINCSGYYGGCDDGPNANGEWHGTHVFGILAARNNGLGVVGVAPNVSDADVFYAGACASSGGCSTTEVALGINQAITDNARVVSMSIAGNFDGGIATAVATAWAGNIVIVAAAGNNTNTCTVCYPAALPNVIGVSGVKDTKGFADSSPCYGSPYSRSGSHVDLAAPFWAYSTEGGNGYATYCGTSMATPHVAGAAALLRAYYPSWSNSQVVNRLYNTSQDLGTAGRDNYYGYGLVDAALAFGIRGASDDYPDGNITGPTQVHPEGVCQWVGTAQHGIRPYASYQWYVGTTLVGTGQNLTIIEPGYSNFYLDLKVTDADGGVGWESRYIVINTQSNQCPH